MSDWELFLKDTKSSYQKIYDMINEFAQTYKFTHEMPSPEVRNLLLDILDEIDVMEDSAIGICDVISKSEYTCNHYKMSLEECDFFWCENN